MQPPIITIILASLILYTALGIDYIRILKNHNQTFRKLIKQHGILIPLSIAAWLLIYIGIKTTKASAPLTQSRIDDWPQHEDLPEFLKRQSN